MVTEGSTSGFPSGGFLSQFNVFVTHLNINETGALKIYSLRSADVLCFVHGEK